MKHSAIIFMVFVFLSGTTTSVPAQEKKKELSEETFWNRLVYGGGLGLSFGNTTQILIAPQVGYRVNDKLIAGAGFMYNYLRVNRIYNNRTGTFEAANFESTIYGPNIFGNYFLAENIFVGSQLEVLNFDNYVFNPVNSSFELNNMWGTALWLEGGYLARFGGNSFARIGIRVNVLHGNASPYANWWMPVMSVFF
jgi:hypothetical protein